MGNFSYICGECGRAIHHADEVVMWMLVRGKVIERMEGVYDQYGRVYDPGTQVEGIKHKLEDSKKWKIMSWGDMTDLHFDDDLGSGIAAVHKGCVKKRPNLRMMADELEAYVEKHDELPQEEVPPRRRSESDPDQGDGPCLWRIVDDLIWAMGEHDDSEDSNECRKEEVFDRLAEKFNPKTGEKVS